MNPEAIIECVPNFSEGTDAAKVSQIVAQVTASGNGHRPEREAA